MDSQTRERLAALHHQGFVLLPAVLAPAQICELHAAIDRLTP
ncbi:MAG TPA: dioxygenase, partial [Pseudomonas sp.]|nr:dioxygenase [Pseudomonas sp.]